MATPTSTAAPDAAPATLTRRRLLGCLLELAGLALLLPGRPSAEPSPRRRQRAIVWLGHK